MNADEMNGVSLCSPEKRHAAQAHRLRAEAYYGNSKQIDRKNRFGRLRASLTKFEANEAGVDVRVKWLTTQPRTSQTP
jgi:hypothetical protein